MRQRPISIMIFGILNICFGLWYMLKLLLAPLMSMLKLPGNAGVGALTSDPGYVQWTNIALRFGAALGLALLIFGIGLLLLKNWARLGSIVCAIIIIVFVLVGGVVSGPLIKRMMEQMPGMSPGIAAVIAMFSMVIGIIFGLAYPVLLLFFMTRSNVIETCQPDFPNESKTVGQRDSAEP